MDICCAYRCVLSRSLLLALDKNLCFQLLRQYVVFQIGVFAVTLRSHLECVSPFFERLLFALTLL